VNIGIERAIKQFFPSSSFLMVFYEAIMNAFDAHATKIHIRIFIDKLSAPKTLRIEIEDNGVGFDDVRFDKFKTLLETDDDEHQGLGRLVFLEYFSKVDIKSYYENKERNFCFDKHFDGDTTISNVTNVQRGTTLVFSDYLLKKIGDQRYITPDDLSQKIMYEFLTKLFLFQQENRYFEIKISLSTKEGKNNPLKNSETTIIKDTLPKLVEEKLQDTNLLSNNRLLYQVELPPLNTKPTKLFAYNIDGRSFPISAFNGLALPHNYNIIFILTSDWLKGKTDSSRTSLALNSEDKKTFEELMLNVVSQKLNEKLPTIRNHNKTACARLNKKFPHLTGYFQEASLGLVEEDRSLNEAQQKFFEDQKAILGAEQLTQEQYNLALIQASRVLTEYILYRNFTINKIKSLDIKSSEDKFHNLIAPKKQDFLPENFSDDMFLNNAWILDDKYMNYSHVLSDRSMNDLLRAIAIDDEKTDDLRPDIAIVFSKNVTDSTAVGVDVVIVELKKKDNDLLQNSIVITQLRQRAQRLIKYYGSKIQRIWYYGIIGFSLELRNHIKGRWTRLYSCGDLYYTEELEWPPDNKDESRQGVPVGYFLNSYDAICNDAAARNETFLNVLRTSIQKSISSKKSS